MMAPPCSMADLPPPTVTATADAATQWQDADRQDINRTPPCPPDRPPMTSLDMIAMARPFWFMDVREVPTRAASALLQTCSTFLEHQHTVEHLQWAHMGRRDLAHYILHRMSAENREGRTAEEMLLSLWWFVSKMQH